MNTILVGRRDFAKICGSELVTLILFVTREPPPPSSARSWGVCKEGWKEIWVTSLCDFVKD